MMIGLNYGEIANPRERFQASPSLASNVFGHPSFEFIK
jgi:hypothetical protein